MRKEQEREKLVQGVVTALWDELGVAKGHAGVVGTYPPTPPVARPNPENWREEVQQLQKTLDAVEERVRQIRTGLSFVDRLDSVD